MTGVQTCALPISKRTLTVRGIKQNLLYARDHTVAEGLEYAAGWNAAMLISDDLREAVGAWLSARLVVARLLVALVIALIVAPSSAQAWWDEAWTARKELTLDTGATGLALGAELDQFPVLVRLHEGVLDFSQVEIGRASCRERVCLLV